MRRCLLVVSILACAEAGWSGPAVWANDDLPRTFRECVVADGDVRRIGDELTCRLVRTYDFRVYGTGTTECGEEIELEIWGESREGVVTYFLAPDKTVELPVLGEEDMMLTEEPIPCLDD